MAQTWDELRLVRRDPRRVVPLDDHEKIRTLWHTGQMTQQQIGDLYGVTRNTISDIIYGRNASGTLQSLCYLHSKRPMPMHLIADRAAALERDRQRDAAWSNPFVPWDEAAG